jgi:type I restriction enzyme, R subunit
LAALLKQRAVAAATRNPTRYDLVQRIEELIADYNAGSVNIDEYLRRLIELSKTLTDEEQCAVTEGLTEEELAVFDLLTKPEPTLTDAERELVKASAKRLLAHLHDKLVLDWRRKSATTADVRTAIRDVLYADLPADPYPPDIFDTKVKAVFDHIITAYGDDGSSVYQGDRVEAATEGAGVATLTAPDIASIADSVVERIRTDSEFASRSTMASRSAGSMSPDTASQCGRRPVRPSASCSPGSTTPRVRCPSMRRPPTSASGGRRRSSGVQCREAAR